MRDGAAPVPARPEAATRPRAWRDWLTLTKPAITGLIVLVAVAGYFLALPGRIDLVRLGFLVVLGWSASSGAAMLNHYLDRDVDARMKRTRERPLPGARIASNVSVAIVGTALAAFGVVGAAVLLDPLAGLSILLGVVTYVVVYTVWLKRRSSWNIVVGGFAGSAPALAGSAAAVGAWTPGVLAFALLVFLWTPPHFWSLALVLRDDYARAGLPMLPKMDDVGSSGRTVVVSAGLLVPATLLLGWMGPVTVPAFLVLLALGAVFVAVAAPLWRNPVRRSALRGFIYSGPYLLAVIGTVVVNWWMLHPGISLGW